MSTIEPAVIAAALRSAAGRARPLWVEASGSSMGRTILPGSRVRIVAAGRPAPGSIWAYCDELSHVVVHRCVRRKGPTYVFQGDGAPVPDAPVGADVLIGVVLEAEHGGVSKHFGLVDRAWRGLPRCAGFHVRRLMRRWRGVASRVRRATSAAGRRRTGGS